MSINMFGRVYDIIWSLFAIIGGLIVIFRRDWFISANSRAFLKLYKKTNFPLFKLQSEKMVAPYMCTLVVMLGIIAIGIGVNTLFNVMGIQLF